jgi:hypothetical protein
LRGPFLTKRASISSVGRNQPPSTPHMGQNKFDDQETDYRPHCFWRAPHREHLCCCCCAAMVGRDDLHPYRARGNCSWHRSSHRRVSKFQHGNSRLENSTSPSKRRDRKTRRDNPPPSSAVSKAAFCQFAWPHWITSSARASSIGRTSPPRTCAVLRLITSSNFAGACAGRSAGFSPLRMREELAAGVRLAVPVAVERDRQTFIVLDD